MKVLVTGAGGFVGQNLIAHLQRLTDVEVLPLSRQSSEADVFEAARNCDVAVHLAGENRPADKREFIEGNVRTTEQLCEALQRSGRPITLIYASSIQATSDTPYGLSKRQAEAVVERFGLTNQSRVCIFRFPNIFGKWARPNYNSAVATFANNIARGIPILINDASAPLSLVYVDDVVARLIEVIHPLNREQGQLTVDPVYSTTVGAVADILRAIKDSRNTQMMLAVGCGLERALHATYLSYLPPTDFSYPIILHEDPRGRFAEVLKTQTSGQFSFFTAHPNITRGGHFHHTKSEKFLVLCGEARFRFKHVLSGETHTILTSGDVPQIVETAPGWAHDITNTGSTELVVMLWANEIFDRENPDTYAYAV